MKRLLAVLVLMVSLACGRQDAVVGAADLADAASGEVTAVRIADGVRVTNGTQGTIPYVVWDLGFLGLLGPCDASCPTLKPGESATVRIGSPGFAGIGEAVVYWWSGPQDPQAPVEQPKSIVVP